MERLKEGRQGDQAIEAVETIVITHVQVFEVAKFPKGGKENTLTGRRKSIRRF